MTGVRDNRVAGETEILEAEASALLSMVRVVCRRQLNIRDKVTVVRTLSV